MAGPLEVRLVCPADNGEVEAVEAFFDACPTSFAQQTIHWKNVVAPIGPDEPLFLACRVQGKIVAVLPAYKFDGPLGSILTTAAQAGALGGVACNALSDVERVYETLLTAFVELARERGCAVATVITNPFWPDHELCHRFLKPDFALENNCQVLDLETAIESNGQFTGTATNVRRNLKKAESCRLFIDEAQTERNVHEWYELHAARHRDIGATPLPRAMFTGALREMIPHDKARFFFVRLLDEPQEMVAGGFYVYHGQVMDALMPSVRTDYRRFAPNFYLAAYTIRWAKARGLGYYNWEGSPPESGVYRFKRQWGSRDAVYYFFTRITGDVSLLMQSSVEFLREAYRWHYVIPYDKLGVGPGESSAASSRKSAWEAMTGA